MSNCDQFRELIEAYALGVLDAEECSAFETHSATGCESCAKALEEARWAVSQLGHIAPDAKPSESLKARLMETVRSEANAVRDTAKHRTGVPVWLWAGVAALVAFSVYSGWEARRLGRDIVETKARAAAELKQTEQLQQQLASAKRTARILANANSRKVVLWPHDTQMPKLEAMWHPELGICVMGEKVPMPASKHALQLWLIPKAEGAKPMAAMTFWPDADGKVVLVVQNPPVVLESTKALAITEEPEGGSAQPTSEPMWVGGIT